MRLFLSGGVGGLCLGRQLDTDMSPDIFCLYTQELQARDRSLDAHLVPREKTVYVRMASLMGSKFAKISWKLLLIIEKVDKGKTCQENCNRSRKRANCEFRGWNILWLMIEKQHILHVYPWGGQGLAETKLSLSRLSGRQKSYDVIDMSPKI